MADLATSIFTSLNTLYAADTGSGGLAEVSDSSNARVRHFVRMGDSDFDGPVHTWAKVLVDIAPMREERSYSKRHSQVMIRMHVSVQRDPLGFTKMSAVNAQLVSVFDRAQPAAQSPFTFSILSYLGQTQAPATGNELRFVHEFSTWATA